MFRCVMFRSAHSIARKCQQRASVACELEHGAIEHGVCSKTGKMSATYASMARGVWRQQGRPGGAWRIRSVMRTMMQSFRARYVASMRLRYGFKTMDWGSRNHGEQTAGTG